jgi:hypothetical protein
MRGEASQGGGGMKPNELAAKLVEIVAKLTGCEVSWEGPSLMQERGPLTLFELEEITADVNEVLADIRARRAAKVTHAKSRR